MINLNEVGPELTKEQKDMAKFEEMIRAGQGQTRELKKLLKYYQDLVIEKEKELEVVANLHQLHQTITIEPEQKSGKSETTAILTLSDWHAEETVDPRKVNNLNEFNLKILDRRVKNTFKNAMILINLWRKLTKIENLIINIKGDIMTGFINEEFVESNALHPTQTILLVMDYLAGGIKFMAKEGGFKSIIIAGDTGNHGRTTEKMRVGTRNENSYEWLMYHILSRILQSEPGISFSIPEGYFNMMDIYGKSIRSHHGDYIKYQGGVGGISIPVNKAIAEWNTGQVAYLDIFAHWHQFIHTAYWISCPCLIGYNMFAIKIKAKYELPGQALIFIEKDKGLTSALKVFV
jgi:hypothetical protein